VPTRRDRLVDCNPRWGTNGDGVRRYVAFDCPEGHEHCFHVIPFTPALDGQKQDAPKQGGPLWRRTGQTFDTLTLTPSIRRRPVVNADSGRVISPCAMHIYIADGGIMFYGDSR
jgi:hypothetical protein